MQNVTVSELVRDMEDNDRNGTTTSSRYVSTNMREDIDRTEAYLNSKHISGRKDSQGRIKPFYNISIPARNIWYRATDVDRKNISVKPTKASDSIKSFLATIMLQEWMKKSGFAKFLNDWGLTLASHGSAVTEFVEKKGELCCTVMDWNEIIVDAVDFDNNVKIKKLWFTPAQLRKQKVYDKKLVKKLLDSLTVRKTIDGVQKDNKAGYISVYEVHGELPLSYITGLEDDEETYVQQMHVVTFQATKDTKNPFEEYTLFSGREAKDPYMISHLIKKDGQTYAGGAVKNLFEAQWMVNDTQKKIKDHLDLCSKFITQTSDSAFQGENIMTNIDQGDILVHKEGAPLTRIDNQADTVAMTNFKSDWQSGANAIAGISEAMRGDNPPSGQAWRTTQALLQESQSLFELMTENKGLAIIDMLTTYVIPFFKKQLNNSDEISAILESYQIKQLDEMYVPNEVIRRMNRIRKETILSGKIFDPATEATTADQMTQELKSGLTGNQRFIAPSDIDNTTWKEVFKNLEWELDIDVTGEAKDIQGTMATLTTVLQTIGGLQGQPMSPEMRIVFDKILSLSGALSPLELPQSQPPTPSPQPSQSMAQPAPVGAPQPMPA